MDVNDQYISTAPSAQNAINLLPGWTSAFPDGLNWKAGSVPLFADRRVSWALERTGPLHGQRVIELGPLEGGHTYQLLRAGADHVTAVDANTYSYLKCLVVKELLRLEGASFLLGDFIAWLEQGRRRADLLWASGVLYHLTDPVRCLELFSQVSDTLFIWTHYVDDDEMPSTDPRRGSIIKTETVSWRGRDILLYQRPYGEGAANVSFMGGIFSYAMWMNKRDILMMLEEFGYRIDILPGGDHPIGPNFSLLARR